MSAITPQTELRILKCPIESDNNNQLTFSSEKEQFKYFDKLPNIKVDNFTYQRKDSIIRFPAHIDSIITYNYVMYQNEAYTNKWFYAFITNMEYVNDNMTYITIKTDVYQTWQFNIEWKKSFVEREHVNNDTLGLHTVPENLETGAYKTYDHMTDGYNGSMTLVSLSTVGPSDLENYSMNMYNGIPTPGVYCKWSSISNFKSFITSLNNNGKIDALISVFICPTWLTGTGGSVYIDQSNTPATQSLGISRISSLDGYNPKNNKMLCYPYCYIGLSNGVGQFSTYKQERWNLTSNEMKIEMKGVLVPSASIKAYPLNYNGDSNCYDESITIGKFPQLAWSNDLYTNWQTQNGVNIGGIRLSATESAIAKGVLQLGVGAAMVSSGNIVGGSFIGGGISDIYGAVQQDYQHSLVPNAVEGSVNSGDVTTMIGANRLHAYRIGITSEYAKIIDDYFTAYGYKVNSYKVPNITGRLNWNYVKTNNANIEGDIPEGDINEIKSLFNRGITLWHNPSTYLDYSQNNTII